MPECIHGAITKSEAFAVGIGSHANVPGLPFLLAACFLIAALIVGWITTADALRGAID